MANKVQDEKNMKILRQLSNEPENKKCMDCGIKGTVYVCSNFNTFICTACSGLHREFNHRVKSISMTTFKPEEIKNLQAGGNAVARRKWLAKWSSEDFPEPDPSDAARVKAFMKLKYIDKRWYSETGEGPTPYVSHHQPPSHGHSQSQFQSQSHSQPQFQSQPAPRAPSRNENYPPQEPLSKILGNDIPPIHINGSTNKQAAPPRPAHVDTPAVNPPGNSNLVDWNSKPKPTASSDLDELLSLPSPQQQSQYQQQLQQHQYQQQQQMIMSQFPQGQWGAPVQAPGYFNPYAQPGFAAAPQQPPGFFGVQTPPNFFAPPPAGAQQQSGGLMGGPAPGGLSPTFGQPANQPHGGMYGASLSPSPTPLSQPQFGGPALSPAQPQGAFGVLSPAQPQGTFGAPSPSMHQPGFAASPAQPPPSFAQSPAQPPPAADKFDIFASLSPLSGATASSVAKSSYNPQASPAHSMTPNLNSNPNSTHNANPNPFGDPFGGATLQPHTQPHATPNQPQSQPAALAADPFGFGGGPAVSPSLHAKPGPQAQSSDPFGSFGASPSPSPQPHQQQQPQQQQQSQSNNANPFGANPFGASPAQPPAQPSSAFSPFSANPFGQQQQQPQSQQPPQQADPWGNSNPFNF